MVNNTNLLNVDSVESLGQKKVLVIDDFANVRKSIKGMLSSIGVSQIVEAATAARAVLAIKDNSFDIVICDYNLGPGRDGQQLLEEVRANNILSYRTVYVMVTAETSRDMVMGAIEFQPDDYLAKPFAFETLKQRVYRWIDRQNKLDRLLGAMDTQNDEKILLESEKVMSGDSRFRSFAQKKAVETMVRLGKSPEARALINQINQKRQQGWTQIELANILVQEKQDLKAIEVLKKALIQEPNLLAGYDLMASCYQRIGDQQSAQDSLKKGVVRSPRNIARQKQLGDVSLELDDIETAAKCYKYVVSLSDETMHENEENHESLIRSIKDLYDQSKDSKEQRRLLADANKFLKDLSNKFQDSESANLFSKVFQYKFAKVDKDKSDKVDGFLKETLAVIESISVELGVDVAQILYEEDRYQDADQLVGRLKEIHKDDQGGVKKLVSLQSEPISRNLRIKAHKLNVQACQFYEHQSFGEAADHFQKALEISPRHPGMILNYIESRMQIVKGEKTPQAVIKNCLGFVHRLEYLEPSHYQYQRYQSILNKLNKLQERFNA